jgi:hypothetical protein
MGMKRHTRGGSLQNLLVVAAAHHGAVALGRRTRSLCHQRRKDLYGRTQLFPFLTLKILRRVWRVRRILFFYKLIPSSVALLW